FGDSKATEAVDQILNAVAGAVAYSVYTNTANLSTSAGQTAARSAALTAGTNAANPIAQKADVATAFANFLLGTDFNQAFVNQLAGAANPVTFAAPALAAATNLQNASFYHDTRAVEMVNATVAAVTNAPT